jgi:D-beta-D-heptose 7-phosphate kinase/D-beta-D-heptose 1-phosphate adenosyltransferase
MREYVPYSNSNRMPKQRSQTLERHVFPNDWTPAERETWLEVWKDVREAKDQLKRVVFVSGVFDLLHEEHKLFLQKARQQGSYLIVAVESDERVRELKGPDRPIQSQQERVDAIWDTGFADAVAVLPVAFSRAEHHVALMKLLSPHFLAVSEHSPHQEGKRAIMELVGGQLVIVHEHNPAVSTTKIIEKGTIA